MTYMEIHDLVGREVRLSRGSERIKSGPGRLRVVRARLIAVEGNNVFATLLEDDPGALTVPNKAGDSGCWNGHSFVLGPVREDLSA